MNMVESQSNASSSAPQVEDIQNKFLSLLQNLPELWREKHGSKIFERKVDVEALDREAEVANQRHLKNNVTLASPSPQQPSTIASRRSTEASFMSSAIPWTASSSQMTMSSRSSHTDQLIAAILDGDIQGIRAVVRTKGEDLTSDYWRDVSRSILPLHRAISGI